MKNKTKAIIAALILCCAAQSKAEIGIVIPTHGHKTWHVIIGIAPIIWYS